MSEIVRLVAVQSWSNAKSHRIFVQSDRRLKYCAYNLRADCPFRRQ